MKAKRALFHLPKGGWQPGRVTLNWSGDPLQDLDWIAESYQSVAHDRLTSFKASGGINSGEEFLAYPIVFLYRQAFELRLKAIVFAGAVLLRDEGEVPMSLKDVMSHELVPLFEEVDRILRRLMSDAEAWDLDEPNLRTRSDFKRIVSEFDAFDKGSYAFRYSVKKDGVTPSLEKYFEFDLFVFSETMDFVLGALAYTPELIRETMQWRWESAYEAQQEEWANAADYEFSDYEMDFGDFYSDSY